MTNEEAIEELEKVDTLDMPVKLCEAHYMSIKALKTISKYKNAYNKGWDDGAKATYEHLKMCEEEQEPCEYAISIEAVLDTIHFFFTEEINKIPTKKTEDGEVYVLHKCQPLFEMNKAICKRIKALPSVTPAERTGHWHIAHGMYEDRFWCDCGFVKIIDNSMKDWKYCPKCGCRMDEPQESEVKQ